MFDIPLWDCVAEEDTGTGAVVGTEFPDGTFCLAPVWWGGRSGSSGTVTVWPRITAASADVTAGVADITGVVIDVVVINGWEVIKSGWATLGAGNDGMGSGGQRGPKGSLVFLT